AARRVPREARQPQAVARGSAREARRVRGRRPAARAARAERRGRRVGQRGIGRAPVILWPAFGSMFAVWNVFQSPGLDFRLITLGALMPLLLDAPFGEQAYAHTLLSAVLVLVLTMLCTTGR